MNYQCETIIDDKRCLNMAVEEHKHGFLLCEECRKIIVTHPEKVFVAASFGKAHQEFLWAQQSGSI